MFDKRYRARIHWIDTETGQTGIYEDSKEKGHATLWRDDEDVYWDDFMWADGNYSCDCNRARLWLDLEYDHCNTERFKIMKLEVLDDNGSVLEDLGVNENQ